MASKKRLVKEGILSFRQRLMTQLAEKANIRPMTVGNPRYSVSPIVALLTDSPGRIDPKLKKMLISSKRKWYKEKQTTPKDPDEKIRGTGPGRVFHQNIEEMPSSKAGLKAGEKYKPGKRTIEGIQEADRKETRRKIDTKKGVQGDLFKGKRWVESKIPKTIEKVKDNQGNVRYYVKSERAKNPRYKGHKSLILAKDKLDDIKSKQSRIISDEEKYQTGAKNPEGTIIYQHADAPMSTGVDIKTGRILDDPEDASEIQTGAGSLVRKGRKLDPLSTIRSDLERRGDTEGLNILDELIATGKKGKDLTEEVITTLTKRYHKIPVKRPDQKITQKSIIKGPDLREPSEKLKTRSKLIKEDGKVVGRKEEPNPKYKPPDESLATIAAQREALRKRTAELTQPETSPGIGNNKPPLKTRIKVRQRDWPADRYKRRRLTGEPDPEKKSTEISYGTQKPLTEKQASPNVVGQASDPDSPVVKSKIKTDIGAGRTTVQQQKQIDRLTEKNIQLKSKLKNSVATSRKKSNVPPGERPILTQNQNKIKDQILENEKKIEELKTINYRTKKEQEYIDDGATPGEAKRLADSDVAQQDPKVTREQMRGMLGKGSVGDADRDLKKGGQVRKRKTVKKAIQRKPRAKKPLSGSALVASFYD